MWPREVEPADGVDHVGIERCQRLFARDRLRDDVEDFRRTIVGDIVPQVAAAKKREGEDASDVEECPANEADDKDEDAPFHRHAPSVITGIVRPAAARPVVRGVS